MSNNTTEGNSCCDSNGKLAEIHLFQLMVGFLGRSECTLGVIFMCGMWEAKDTQESAPLSRKEGEGNKTNKIDVSEEGS